MGEIFEWAARVILIVTILYLLYRFFQAIRLVSTQTAHIVERLGKYQRTLDAGFHALIPFIDRVTAVQDLREEALDVPPQECFTRDEVQVTVSVETRGPEHQREVRRALADAGFLRE